MRDPFADTEQKMNDNIRAMQLTFDRLPFVAGTANPSDARLKIIQHVCSVAAAEIETETAASEQTDK